MKTNEKLEEEYFTKNLGSFITRYNNRMNKKPPGHFLLVKLDGTIEEPDGGYNKQS